MARITNSRHKAVRKLVLVQFTCSGSPKERFSQDRTQIKEKHALYMSKSFSPSLMF